MKKLAEIDCPIRCPHYHEGTCFYYSTITVTVFCDWHQGMKADAFPVFCPLEDAPSQDVNTQIKLLKEEKNRLVGELGRIRSITAKPKIKACRLCGFAEIPEGQLPCKRCYDYKYFSPRAAPNRVLTNCV